MGDVFEMITCRSSGISSTQPSAALRTRHLDRVKHGRSTLYQIPHAPTRTSPFLYYTPDSPKTGERHRCLDPVLQQVQTLQFGYRGTVEYHLRCKPLDFVIAYQWTYTTPSSQATGVCRITSVSREIIVGAIFVRDSAERQAYEIDAFFHVKRQVMSNVIYLGAGMHISYGKHCKVS
ncbi:hypothetical protein ASPZODRAFT_1303261 [Penicilliopsis zonata CBS 506.65]|uniref:Uncharacterized protein n=1 Tax=Penicilliopsis zonata CBS 506.65 TaxID=1073090 RepID=A0A1L9S5T0_9EURO|nr:hypothetical protein ASPZODRAFT_1303261 [Penicilliopsis zonata CBS 506.65]OJJ42526.1 hypothetical protein ASPZODRAFT_1303261 [Penicilliopsis zonata CBS 506.65]